MLLLCAMRNGAQEQGKEGEGLSVSWLQARSELSGVLETSAFLLLQASLGSGGSRLCLSTAHRPSQVMSRAAVGLGAQ